MNWLFIRLDLRLNIIQFQKERYSRIQETEIFLLRPVPEKSETKGRTLLAKPLQQYGCNWMIGCLNPCWAGSRPIRLGMWGANNDNNNHEFGSTQSPSTWMRRNIVQVKPDNIHYNTSDNQQSPRCLATQLFESGDMIYWSWPIWSQSTHTTWGFTVIRSRKERNTPPLC